MNGTEILKALDLSSAAYRDIQAYSPYTCIAILGKEKSMVEYFLRKDNDTLWITFRGTNSIQEWISNLTFSKKVIPYDEVNPEIKVHTGFINAYKTKGVRNRILKSITEDIHYVKVCGHSRGAALAVLCSLDIQYNFPNRDMEVILFGCPRVGNEAFVKSYNKRINKTVRVENGNDIITKLPFVFMGYRHVGAKLHIGNLRLPFCFSAKDHYPHKYYSALLNKKLIE